MNAHPARGAIVVAQDFHIARATLACHNAGIEISGAGVPA
jgi:vancomycin permeability regulator SanA